MAGTNYHYNLVKFWNYLFGRLLRQGSQTARFIIIDIYCLLYCYRMPEEIRKIETGRPNCHKLMC